MYETFMKTKTQCMKVTFNKNDQLAISNGLSGEMQEISLFVIAINQHNI